MTQYGQIAEHVGNFSRGTVNSLFLKVTDIDGMAKSAERVKITINSTEPYGEDAVYNEVASTVQSGYYFYEWEISNDAQLGTYLITWTYLIDDVEQSVVQYVVVNDRPEAESAYWGFLNDLRVSLEFHIRPAMNIPVYFEQSKPSRDRMKYRFSFPRWNQTAGVKVYRNQEIVESGVTVNYFRGEIEFSEPQSVYDVINCDYNFRWFDDSALYRFLQNGVDRFNYYPPVSYYSLSQMPDRAITPTIYAATVDALRELMMSLQFQEPQIVFGGPEKSQNVFGNFDTLKKNYEESLKSMLDAKKNGPYTGLTKMIVVPEYTLPGGRSRWFRYLFSGSNI